MYMTKDRLRLFDAIVTPILLYGCGAWALTRQQESTVKSLQRKMLRYVLRIFRKTTSAGDLEDWVDYMKRSAEVVDAQRQHHNMEEWIVLSRRKKWRFAGQTARRTDNRWSHLLINWKPNFGHGRLPGRPWTRWSDDLVAYAGGSWDKVAADEDLWNILEHGYENHSIE
jgi:hypothetical protein